jgi:hypothetical protein
MTIQRALDMTDKMLANTMDRELKLYFLTQIEQMIHQEIVLKHHHEEIPEEPPVYTTDTDPGTELRIPDPYSDLYYYYLMSKIDEQNLEFDKFNSHRLMFENLYGTMSDWYTREHMPLGVPQLRM